MSATVSNKSSRYGLTRTAGPMVEPLSVADVMASLDIQRSDQESMIARLIQTARELVEEQTNRQLITATWELSLDRFPCGPILLPRCPVQSVTSVEYTATDGAAATLSSANYDAIIDCEPAEIHIGYGLSWPATRDKPRSVIVEFEAGYGDAATDAPARVRSLLMMMVGGLYEMRESSIASAGLVAVLEVPAVRSLLDSLRYGDAYHNYAAV